MAIQVQPRKLLTPKRITLLVGIVLLFIFFLTSLRQINTGNVGVVTRFGRVTNRELSEGIHLVLPFGIEQVSVYDVKVGKISDEIAASTIDLQDVNTTIALNYKLDRARVSEMHRNVGKAYAEKLIEPAINEVFKSASAQYNAADLLAKRAEVKQKTVEALTDRLAKYGIQVEDLSVVNFKFSDTFTKAIEEKQAAEQNVQRAKFNLTAAQTDAEAQKAQSVTLSDLFLKKQAIEKWDGKMPQYVGGGESVFNIPLR